ncbi:hypothetical protein Lal_00042298 [Lupinus albus]|nr:hypothetical protein Lal_00042298 [Lupinus albus]
MRRDFAPWNMSRSTRNFQCIPKSGETDADSTSANSLFLVIAGFYPSMAARLPRESSKSRRQASKKVVRKSGKEELGSKGSRAGLESLAMSCIVSDREGDWIARIGTYGSDGSGRLPRTIDLAELAVAVGALPEVKKEELLLKALFRPSMSVELVNSSGLVRNSSYIVLESNPFLEESPATDLEVSVDSLLETPGSTPATGSTPNLVGQSVGNSILSVSASANLVETLPDLLSSTQFPIPSIWDMLPQQNQVDRVLTLRLLLSLKFSEISLVPKYLSLFGASKAGYLLSVLAELALFYSLRSQLVIKMMLASAKIDLPIQTKGIGLVLSVPDTRQGQDQNYVQALFFGDLSVKEKATKVVVTVYAMILYDVLDCIHWNGTYWKSGYGFPVFSKLTESWALPWEFRLGFDVHSARSILRTPGMESIFVSGSNYFEERRKASFSLAFDGRDGTVK